MQVAGFDVLHEVAAAPQLAQGRRTMAAERLRLQALQLARSERLVQAAFSYRIVPLEGPAGPALRVGGEELHAPRLLPASGELTGLACCACTIGPALEERVRALFAQDRPQLAATLEALGDELLAAVIRRALDRIHAEADQAGLDVSGQVRPGDGALSAQARGAVLRLAGAERVGVELGSHLLLRPHTSATLVLGVGIGLPPADWSRCEECPRRRACRVAARARAVRPARSVPA